MMNDFSVAKVVELENGRKVMFRQIGKDGPANNWQVEIYSTEGGMFPVGWAFVLEVPGKVAQLNFAIVADQWRRQLFYHDLLAAIGERWPGYHRTGKMESGTMDRSQLRATLEAIDAAAVVCPWGVSALPSVGAIIVWDAREESSFAIVDATAGAFGDVGPSVSIETEGRTLIGAIITPTDASELSDLAGRLRVAYAIATGAADPSSDDPF